MSKLVIVESPNKIESIKKYLGAGYDVMASKGHIVVLPSSGDHNFGVDMTNWTPNYKIALDKKDIVANLKAASKKADIVLIATDPDREGEAIADNLVEFLNVKDKYQRIRFNEITKEAVNAAVNNPTVVDEKLVESQIARRILDRIIGYKLSSLMKSKIQNTPTSPSAGRVQSIALKLVVEREREIQAFVPFEYKTLDAKIKEGVVASFNEGNYGPMKDGKQESNKTWVNPKDINEIRSKLKGALKVVDISTSTKKDGQQTPLKQAALYKKADSSLGLSSDTVQRAAQRLYEGFGDGGLISYPRTDSTRYSQSFVIKAQEFINKTYGAEYVEEEIKGAAGAQDAHEAIRPTDLAMTPQKASALFNLSPAELKVYTLIYQHTLQTLMKVPVREILRYDLEENGLDFKLSASKIIFDGYLKVTGFEKSKELPVYRKGEIIPVEDYLIEDHQTNPPARYNDGSLIETLDNIGVGRPSTFSTTVNVLKEREYVTLEGRALKPTDFGFLVNDKLIEAFPEIINESYTANMEKELDEIAENKHDYRRILQEFWDSFEKELQTATSELDVTKLMAVSANKDCPVCGSPMVVRRNKKDGNKFFACSNFPTCTHTESDPDSKPRFFKKKWTKK